MAKETRATFMGAAGVRETKTGYEDLFWEMDKDRSGTLSLRELAKLLMKSGYTLSKEELEAKFSGMDSDSDGMVSYDEYLKAMGAVPSVSHRQAFYRRKFKRYDINKDGMITVDELIRVFEDIGATSNVDYAKEVFAQCDQDGTGKIEFEEFIKYFCTGD